MARMRTVPQAIREMHAADPGCGLSVWTLRKWCEKGIIPTVVLDKRRYLVNLDHIENYINGGHI